MKNQHLATISARPFLLLWIALLPVRNSVVAPRSPIGTLFFADWHMKCFESDQQFAAGRAVGCRASGLAHERIE
jgi:hypothetical protein